MDVSIFSQSGHHDQLNRRKFFQGTAFTFISASGILPSSPCQAEEAQEVFKRINAKNKFGYSLVLPPSFSESNKPLQTHLDEINLSDPNIKGCQIGITVDPIRLKSLKDFGTPDEVAAKIVMAELNRDGILDVTLGRDATEDKESGAYDVEYISDGKRGKKHNYTRTVVNEGKLYVLTATIKDDKFNDSKEAEILQSLRSFRVINQGDL